MLTTTSKSRNNTFLVVAFAGILAALGGGLYFFLFKSAPAPSPRSATKEDLDKLSPPKKGEVTAEDVEDDDEEEDEEEEEGDVAEASTDVDPADDKPSEEELAEIKRKEEEAKAKEQELKAQFDDAVRLGTKLMQGQSYVRAAEKFKEAIHVAEQVPAYNKQLITLYNNCSAMHEKAGNFDESLGDISVILAMDPLHLKSRARRARIYHAQNKLVAALDDFVIGLMIEQSRGQPPTNSTVIDDLNKEMSSSESVKLMKKVLATQTAKPMPSKSHLKNYFESFPSFYEWEHEAKSQDREELQAAAKADADPMSKLASVLALAKYDFSHHRFTKAFDALFTDDNEILAAEAAKAADDGAPAPALSTWCELKGSKLHLTAEYTKASEAFELACSYDSGNVNAPLKMAMLHMDTGDNDKCLAVYDDILAKCDGDAALFPLAGKAWALAHRSSYWTTRDEKSKYMPEACEKSRADIDASLDITECVKPAASSAELSPAGVEVMRGARLSCLLKTVHLYSQTKAQTGSMPTEEEKTLMKERLEEASEMFPSNINTQLLQADQKASDGDTLAALTIVDKVVEEETTYAVPLVIKGNFMTQAALTELQETRNPANIQRVFAEVEELYKKAIELEPHSQEAPMNYAHLKCFMGDLAGARDLIEGLVPGLRTREEAQDVFQLLLLYRSQCKAHEFLQASNFRP